jgi:hypothetical protein
MNKKYIIKTTQEIINKLNDVMENEVEKLRELVLKDEIDGKDFLNVALETPLLFAVGGVLAHADYISSNGDTLTATESIEYAINKFTHILNKEMKEHFSMVKFDA